MGLPMAIRLLEDGFRVSGFDIRHVDEFGSFASAMHRNAAEMALAEVIISVVRDEEETLALCFDDQAVFRRENHPSILVICSTLSPRFVTGLAARLPEGVKLVDAPMSGAPFSAARGSLTFMLGGESSTLDYLLPVFNCMGETLFRTGPAGSGMALKVLNNLVAASSVVAVRRAMDMASALDIDIGMLLNVMTASSGATWFGDHYRDISWSQEGYDKSNTIGILEKDVLSALDAVKDLPQLQRSEMDQALIAALRSLEPDQSLNR